MAESELGFPIGGAGLEQLSTVFCGSGRNTETVETDIGDLIRLSRGNVYPISTNGN